MLRLTMAVLLVLMSRGYCDATQIVLKGYALDDSVAVNKRLAERGEDFIMPSVEGQSWMMTISSDWNYMHTDGRYRLHITDFVGGLDCNDGSRFHFVWTPYDEIPNNREVNTVSVKIENGWMGWNVKQYDTDIVTFFERFQGGLWLRLYDDNGLIAINRLGPSYSIIQFNDVDGDWLSGERLIDVSSVSVNDEVIDDGSYSSFGLSNIRALYGLPITSMQIIHDDLIPGDANDDGVFDQFDIVQVMAAGRYKNGSRVSWSNGDWNADGVFDQLDLVVANQAGMYGVQSAREMSPLPEPSTMVLVLIGMMMLMTVRYRNNVTVEPWMM